MNKYFYYVSILFLLIFSSCSNENIEFKADQTAFTQTLAMILKANADAYKFVEANKNGSIDTTSINKNTRELITAYTAIISESEKVSDKFLDYISPEFKTKFRDLISINKTMIENSETLKTDADAAKEFDKKVTAVEESFWNYFQEHQSDINKKLPGIEQDFKVAMKKYNVPNDGEEKTGIEKSYWGMLWRLFIGDFAITFIFSLLVVILVYKTILVVKVAEKFNSNIIKAIFIVPSTIIGFVAQASLWTLWAAFCSFSVKYFIDSPTVTHNWLYYTTGFFAAVGPMSWLSSKEQDTTESAREKNRIAGGSFLYILLIIASFIVFCIYPNLMNHKYISFVYDWLY